MLTGWLPLVIGSEIKTVSLSTAPICCLSI